MIVVPAHNSVEVQMLALRRTVAKVRSHETAEDAGVPGSKTSSLDYFRRALPTVPTHEPFRLNAQPYVSSAKTSTPQNGHFLAQKSPLVPRQPAATLPELERQHTQKGDIAGDATHQEYHAPTNGTLMSPVAVMSGAISDNLGASQNHDSGSNADSTKIQLPTSQAIEESEPSPVVDSGIGLSTQGLGAKDIIDANSRTSPGDHDVSIGKQQVRNPYMIPERHELASQESATSSIECQVKSGDVRIFKRFRKRRLYVGASDKVKIPSDLLQGWESDKRDRLGIDLADLISALRRKSAKKGSKQSESHVTYELRMSGYAENGDDTVVLTPCIWILCGSKWAAAMVNKAVQEYTWIRRFTPSPVEVHIGGAILATSSEPTLNILGLDMAHGIEIAEGVMLYINIEDNIEGQSHCGSLCCATIQHGQTTVHHFCRIGGLISARTSAGYYRAFGLSTAHGMLDNTFFLQSIGETNITEAPSHFGSQSASHGENDQHVDNSDAEYDETVDMGEHDSESLSNASDTWDEIDQEQRLGYRDPRTVTRWKDATGGMLLSFLGRTVSMLDNTSEIIASRTLPKATDHALLDPGWAHTVPPPCLGNTDSKMIGPFSTGCCVDSFVAEDNLVVDSVDIICAPHISVPGRLLEGSTAFVVRDTTFTLRKIETNSVLASGISGSWVVKDGVLYGMILAVFEREPFALMMTASRVFENLKSEVPFMGPTDMVAEDSSPIAYRKTSDSRNLHSAVHAFQIEAYRGGSNNRDRNPYNEGNLVSSRLHVKGVAAEKERFPIDGDSGSRILAWIKGGHPRAAAPAYAIGLSDVTTFAATSDKITIDEETKQGRPKSAAPLSIIGLSDATTIVEETFDAETALPDKKGGRRRRGLRYSIFVAYKVLFCLIGLSNFVAAIALLSTGIQHQWVGNLTAINLLIGVLVRQDIFVNVLSAIFCSVPRSWPLWIRSRCANIIYIGVIQPGANICAAFWFTGYTLGATICAATKNCSNDWTAQSTATKVVSWSMIAVLIALLTLKRLALRKKNDSIKYANRYLSWGGLGLFWGEIILTAKDYTKTNALTLGTACLQSPSLWLLAATTLSVAFSWFGLRKVPVQKEILTDHVAQLFFTYKAVPGHHWSLSRVSCRSFAEWSSVPIIPGQSPRDTGHSVLVPNTGDWPCFHDRDGRTYVWVRGVPMCGIMRIATLFNRIVIIATGEGIEHALGHIQTPPCPTHLIWSVRNPVRTYGEEIIRTIRVNIPDAVIHDTQTLGRPDLVKMSYNMAKGSKAEAVIVLSNQKITKKVVYGLRSRGVCAYSYQ